VDIFNVTNHGIKSERIDVALTANNGRTSDGNKNADNTLDILAKSFELTISELMRGV